MVHQFKLLPWSSLASNLYSIFALLFDYAASVDFFFNKFAYQDQGQKGDVSKTEVLRVHTNPAVKKPCHFLIIHIWDYSETLVLWSHQDAKTIGDTWFRIGSKVTQDTHTYTVRFSKKTDFPDLKTI